jgi:hypothetical protein
MLVPPDSEDDNAKLKLLIESIDESLAALLGQAAKDAFYAHLAKRLALETGDIPEWLDDFNKYMQETFGQNAAAAIERNILTRFYYKLDLNSLRKTAPC